MIELQIGDSPFASTTHALEGGIKAINDKQTHYCPSLGLPSFRETVAAHFHKEYGIRIGPENVVVGPGAKIFEQFFLRGLPRSGRCRARVQPAFSHIRSQHRTPWRPDRRSRP